MTDNPLLSIADYSLTIDGDDGPFEVLKRLNLDPRRGETPSIVGESGSGKTVLVRSLMGIGPKRSRVTSGASVSTGRTWRGCRTGNGEGCAGCASRWCFRTR